MINKVNWGVILSDVMARAGNGPLINLLKTVRDFTTLALKRETLSGDLSACNYAQSDTQSGNMYYNFNGQRLVAETLNDIIPALQVEVQLWC